MNNKLYKVGMYGGKFMPLHLGHLYCIQTAMKECETLHVILFFGGADEERILKEYFGEKYLSLEERIKQLQKICLKIRKEQEKILFDSNKITFTFTKPSIIFHTIDVSECRTSIGEEDWDAETPLVRSIVGPQLDAVYSSEPSYGEYFSRAYPEAVHRLVDVKRLHYPISGTIIRQMTNKEEKMEWMV